MQSGKEWFKEEKLRIPTASKLLIYCTLLGTPDPFPTSHQVWASWASALSPLLIAWHVYGCILGWGLWPKVQKHSLGNEAVWWFKMCLDLDWGQVLGNCGGCRDCFRKGFPWHHPPSRVLHPWSTGHDCAEVHWLNPLGCLSGEHHSFHSLWLHSICIAICFPFAGPFPTFIHPLDGMALIQVNLQPLASLRAIPGAARPFTRASITFYSYPLLLQLSLIWPLA